MAAVAAVLTHWLLRVYPSETLDPYEAGGVFLCMLIGVALVDYVVTSVLDRGAR